MTKLNYDTAISEANTENIFRDFYGATSFIEKSAIPKRYGFKSKNGTEYKGYPDFFKQCEDFVIVVEAKATEHEKAKEEVQWYMKENKISQPIFGIAISGQGNDSLKCTEYFLKNKSSEIIEISDKGSLTELDKILQIVKKQTYGDDISDEALTTILTELNNLFHKNGVRDTDRSLFFSGIMIALTNNNFRNTYHNIPAPTTDELSTTKNLILESHYLNKAILDAITEQIEGKINNLSKEFSWADRFSFIKTIDIPLDDYKEKIIERIETKIYIPFKHDEKQDILGRAYKIFLKRAGKVDNKNIILTPDHIKSFMVKLARLTVDDVVLDTCTGSGGFLMEAMEVMTNLANGDSEKISKIQNNQLIGFEIDPILFSLACSNMFLHGDGRTNMLFRSSLIKKDNDQDAILKKYIKSLKPNKIIINPPYENNGPIKFTLQALDYLEPGGKLIIIMPSVTLSDKADDGSLKDILDIAKLDFVIKMPVSIFKEQKRTVYTSIFGFTKTPMSKEDQVIFGTLKDDGLVSVQNKGRLDKNKVWPSIEKKMLDSILQNNAVDGFSEKRRIFTDSGEIVFYGIDDKIETKYPLIPIGELFNTEEKGSLASSDADPEGECIFITAAKEWARHSVADKNCEAIVYVCDSEGSYGRAHYINGEFIASNLCRILTPKNPEKYPINLEFYHYYFNSIREKIISDIAIGTSKLTLRERHLNSYKIEYIPIDEQNEMLSKIKERESELKLIEQQYQDKQNQLYSGISNLK